MRLPRLRIRHLIIVVAVVSIALGAFRVRTLARRSSIYKLHATLQRDSEQMWIRAVKLMDKMPAPPAERLSEARADAAEAARLRKAYEHLAACPWERTPTVAETYWYEMRQAVLNAHE